MHDTLTTVYGAQSATIVQGAVETAAKVRVWTESGWFQAMAIAVLVLWCVMIYLYRRQAVVCLKTIVDFKADERASEQIHIYNRFTDMAVVVAVAASGLAAVKVFARFAGITFVTPTPGWLPPVAAVAVALTLALIMVLESGVIAAIGKLTFSRQMAEELTATKKIYLSAVAVVLVPPVLLYTGLSPGWDAVMGYSIVAEAVIITAIFVAKTCTLFIRQKVSLLVWFLYLCAVEIFPIGLVLLLAVKNL